MGRTAAMLFERETEMVRARPDLIEGAAAGRLLRDEPLDPASAAFALSALVREAADVAQPLLVVDDAHWGDASSLSWLAQVGADAPAMSVGVMLAARPAEPGATAQLEVFRAAAGMVVVRPRLLASASVGALVRTRLPEAEDDFCAACARASGGNPFLALSLVDGGDGSDASSGVAPRLVRATTMVRVSRAGEEAVALAHAVAVLERSSRLDDAAALARLDLAAAVRAADQLRASEILADGPDLDEDPPAAGLAGPEATRGVA